MYNKAIGKVVEKTEIISEKLEAITFNSIRKVLPNSTILDACRKAKYRYRRRIITPVSIVLHMIIAAIWPQESFNAAWQLVWAAFSASFLRMAGKSPSRATVAKARKRLPLVVWQKITTWICQQVQECSASMDKWRSHRVMLEAVIENNVAPTRISLVAAVRIIITYAPAMAMRPLHQLSDIYHAMLKEIAGWLVPERPGRLEPRRLSHDPKHYPRLRITRAQWRKQYVA